MADDKLAQADIDALIAKVRGGNASQAKPKDDTNSKLEKLGITPADLKGLEKLFKTSIEASCEVLQSVTQKSVTVDSINEIKVTGRKTLSELIEPPYIATKVDFVIGIKGSDLLLMKQEDLNLLMKYQFEIMGYDPGDADEELIMSCSNEIMNQMMGHASNKLGNELGIFIDISTPESHVIEKKHVEEGQEIAFLKEDELSYIYLTFKLNVNGVVTGNLVKVLDSNFIPELREIMKTNKYIEDYESENEGQDLSSTETKESTTDETVPPVVEQNNTVQATHQPAFEQPMYDQMHQQPMQQPMYDQMYQQPMQQPMYDQMYQQPMQQPMYQQPQSKNIIYDESVDVKPYSLPNLTPTFNGNTVAASSNRIKSVEVELTVELGRTRMTVKDILELDKGSIIELNSNYTAYVEKSA